MFEIIDIEQRTPAWIQFRLRHIGASDASAIMGVSPWKSALQLWLEKTNLDVSGKNYVSPQMQRGIDLESKALECFNRYIGSDHKPFVIKSIEYPWMAASLDGISFFTNTFVEIKCPNMEDHLKALSGKVPEKYYPQLQHQLAATGMEFAYYFSFDGEDGIYLRVDRDEDYIRDLIAKEREFWHCVETLTEPKDKFIHKDDEEWKNLAEKYLCLLKEQKEVEEELEQLKAGLIHLTNGNASKGSGISLLKITRKGSVDYSSIPELEKVDLEKYRRPGIEYWKVDLEK
jgi:putative phage-type endonuclease